MTHEELREAVARAIRDGDLYSTDYPDEASLHHALAGMVLEEVADALAELHRTVRAPGGGHWWGWCAACGLNTTAGPCPTMRLVRGEAT